MIVDAAGFGWPMVEVLSHALVRESAMDLAKLLVLVAMATYTVYAHSVEGDRIAAAGF